MNRTKLYLLALGALAVTTSAVRGQPPDLKMPEIAPAPRETMENPRVEPGQVKWHKSFADSLAAAKESGKPVLLFQLMGQLDRQYL